MGVVVMMMVMVTGGKRRASKRHQQQCNSKNFLHREHPSMRLVSRRQILTPLVSKVQRKWHDGACEPEVSRFNDRDAPGVHWDYDDACGNFPRTEPLPLFF